MSGIANLGWIDYSRELWEGNPKPKVCRARDSRWPNSAEWVIGKVEYVYIKDTISPFVVVHGDLTDCYDICQVFADDLTL